MSKEKIKAVLNEHLNEQNNKMKIVKHSDLKGKWSAKGNNVKLNSIPDVTAKLKEVYLKYLKAFKIFDKQFEAMLVAEIGLKPDEASYIAGEYMENAIADNKDYDLTVGVMGMACSVFDEITSLKEKFGSLDDFKEEVKAEVTKYQDAVGEEKNSDGDYLGDLISYDEDSEEFVNMFYSGLTAEQAFEKIKEHCGIQN